MSAPVQPLSVPLNIDFTKLDARELADIHVSKVLTCFAAFGNKPMKYEDYQPFYEKQFPKEQNCLRASQFKDAISHWKKIVEENNLGFAHKEGEDTDCVLPKGENHRVCKLSANNFNGTGYKGRKGHGRAVLAYIDTRYFDIFNTSGRDTPPPPQQKPKVYKRRNSSEREMNARMEKRRMICPTSLQETQKKASFTKNRPVTSVDWTGVELWQLMQKNSDLVSQHFRKSYSKHIQMKYLALMRQTQTST